MGLEAGIWILRPRGGYGEREEEGEISPCVKAKVIGPIFDWSNIFFTASYITLL